MYYSNGNYEAFANPLKPEGVDAKSVYIVGAGLAGMSAAAFLIRDGQMAGERIHIFESYNITGGACDGIYDPTRGFVIRGGREMENHFECLWDLYRSIPSLETEGVSVLDEYYWLNKRDPNFSLNRSTKNQGQDGGFDFKFALSDKALMEISKVIITPNERLYDKKITDIFSDEFFKSNFWMYWRTMFAFEAWHSALEMKLYMLRFIHHIDGLPDFSALKFAAYNTYEALMAPLTKFLEDRGVDFIYDTKVRNIVFDIDGQHKTAKQIVAAQNGAEKIYNLGSDDLVIATLGSCVESSSLGTNDTAADINVTTGDSYELWSNIAAQDPAFGRPDKFFGDQTATNWESATINLLDDKIIPYIEAICKRDPYSGRTVTGGIVTAQDSSWLCSWNVGRQPIFKSQPKDQIVIWFYGLFSNVPGDYIKKPMTECTGKEIAAEFLYHIGVPVADIDELAANSMNTVPCYLPYITAFFMPRSEGDRPAVVPAGSTNFAFIGEFVETPNDTVFTTEYAVRTGMEAAYTLLNIDRGVPEVFDSRYDIRSLLKATHHLLDGRKVTDVKLPGLPHLFNLIEKGGIKAIQGTEIEQLLKQYELI